MHTLARIANKLNQPSQAASWRKQADELLKKFVGAMYKDGIFVALQSHTHDFRPDPSSLLVHIPVVLGELLDPAIMNAEAGILEKRFLTEYGLATEAPDSPRYEADGYWRGPIWAPPTYLIVDGLRRGGHERLAGLIARRYIKLSAKTAKGNYENFDALTGKGLRAPGYTWSASVYLLLCEEYPS
jgi:glycogen debranching enzyme